MIRLVAYDLDGTLIGPGLKITQRVLDAVTRARDAGVDGCVVTGRMYRAALPFARELHFEAPLICYQGAAIVDPTTDEVLFDQPLQNDVVRELIALTQADGMHLQLYRNDEYYCESRNRYSALYASLAMTEPVIVPSLREAFAYSPATKAVVIADPAAASAYETRLREALGGKAYVTRSLPQFVEVLDPTVDKGTALRFVAQGLGIPMEETAAIGDSWNDVPLLEAAGVSIAMGSAPAELKTAATAVVDDVEHDGVAEALDRYVLE